MFVIYACIKWLRGSSAGYYCSDKLLSFLIINVNVNMIDVKLVSTGFSWGNVKVRRTNKKNKSLNDNCKSRSASY